MRNFDAIFASAETSDGGNNGVQLVKSSRDKSQDLKKARELRGWQAHYRELSLRCKDSEWLNNDKSEIRMVVDAKYGRTKWSHFDGGRGNGWAVGLVLWLTRMLHDLE